jgi:ketosteroid isomerase-like protein/predicted ester cyclase
MLRMMILVVLVTGACKGKDEKSAAAPTVASGSQLAEAATPARPPAVDAATAKSGDDIAKRYEECIALANEARWDEFENCYAGNVMFEAPGKGEPRTLDVEVAAAKKTRGELPDYKQAPQLVLVSGNTVIAIELHTATSTKTKKPIGFLLAHVIGTDPTGKATRDLAFWDANTVEGQRTGKPGVRAIATPFPTKTSLIAKDDDVEKQNLATFTQMMEASENKDLVAFGEKLAGDVVWSVVNRPKDLTKAEILAGIKTRLEKTDLHYRVDHAWAAGDYVASIETVSGTATAESPDKKFKKGDKIERQLLAIHRFANGKLAQVWVFVQG